VPRALIDSHFITNSEKISDSPIHPNLTSMKIFLSLLLFLFPILVFSQAKTDTIQVYSPAMKKNLKAAVTTPSSYQKGAEKYPVIYLLHGGSGTFSDWHKNVTEPGLVERMAEEYDLIIDCGVDDFLISTNRQMHQLLLDNRTPHEYIERPGAHTWPYWTEALPLHLLFFDRYLKRE
jgi:enterochelin esterase-like enzyme